jgi:hypothetical protein
VGPTPHMDAWLRELRRQTENWKRHLTDLIDAQHAIAANRIRNVATDEDRAAQAQVWKILQEHV